MQNLEERLVTKARQAEVKTGEQLFKAWKRAETTEERENIWHQIQALEKLTNNIIHAIRGEKNG